MAERLSISQNVLLGVEATPGVKPGAGAFRDLALVGLDLDGKLDMQSWVPEGRRNPALTRSNKDWSEGKGSGELSYTEIIYPLSSILGAATITTPTNGVNARQWKWDIPLFGGVTPQTYWLQEGDYGAVRTHEAGYCFFTGVNLKGDRNGVTMEAPLVGQAIVDNATYQAGAVLLPTTPVMGKHWSLYRDATSAALGTTLLTRALSWDFSYLDVFDVLWPGNRASNTWAVPVDREHKNEFKAMLEADANGMLTLADARVGNLEYWRLLCQGDVIDNQQTVTITGAPTGGTFTLSYKGQTTAGIAYNATAGTVQSAVQALSTVGSGNATVSGSAGGPYTVTMAGTLSLDTTALTASGAGLTGGSSPAATVASAAVYQTLQIDLCLGFMGDIPFSDKDGIFAAEWAFEYVEDQVWGHVGQVTVINSRAAL